jgi:hypothetical protein
MEQQLEWLACIARGASALVIKPQGTEKSQRIQPFNFEWVFRWG